MKTRDEHAAEQQHENPIAANWPLIRIIAYMLVGGILMTVLTKTFPPENPPMKPAAVQAMPRR